MDQRGGPRCPRVVARPTLGGVPRRALGSRLRAVSRSPLDAHAASPEELRDRIAAERRGAPFLVYRTDNGGQVLLDLGTAGDRVTIGRRATNDVPLEWDSQVSRVHAALERVGDEWAVMDDGLSHNGTWVNGERLAGRRRLSDGDTISVGATLVAFRAPGGSSASRATVSAVGPQIGELLTPAQRRVLLALCRPFKDSPYGTPATNQRIADELVVSVDTVKGTLRALFDAFGIGDLPQNEKRATLALQALRTGVVSRRDL
jgi:pSer/pThr/pTyr-binding forkhead associated (FHA) protein